MNSADLGFNFLHEYSIFEFCLQKNILAHWYFWSLPWLIVYSSIESHTFNLYHMYYPDLWFNVTALILGFVPIPWDFFVPFIAMRTRPRLVSGWIVRKYWRTLRAQGLREDSDESSRGKYKDSSYSQVVSGK